MSDREFLRDECVRLLRELLPELSGHKLSSRGENICFAAINRLARLGLLAPCSVCGRRTGGCCTVAGTRSSRSEAPERLAERRRCQYTTACILDARHSGPCRS
jgi:hypothetical protein